jgi:hypothetical protein
MLNRKINPESFQEELRDRRSNIHEEIPSTPIQSNITNSQWIEPETGEIFNRSNPSSVEAPFYPTPQSNVNTPNSQNMIKTPNPFLSISRTYVTYAFYAFIMMSQLFLTWLIYTQPEELRHSMKQSLVTTQEFSKQISAQNNQISLLIDDMSELNDAIDSLIEGLPPTKSLINKTHIANNDQDQTPKKQTHKAILKKSTSPSPISSSIKYLGSGMRDELHHVLLETPTGIQFHRIGDIVFNQWRLSAIEPQKILVTTANGQQQIIQLSKVLP